MRNLTLLTQQSANCPGYKLVFPIQRDQPTVTPPLSIDSGNQKIYGVFRSVDEDDNGLAIFSLSLGLGQKLSEDWEKVAFIPDIPSNSTVSGFQYLGDDEALFLATDNGDIIKIHLEQNYSHANPEAEEMYPNGIEKIGDVESGIQHACWSPDEELLTMVTGENKLIIMTKDFDVISEFSLYTDEKGKDQLINVGWGKKETQFHGKAGKAEAQRKPEEKQTRLSNDDDGVTRISWRGDAAYFVVSLCLGDRRQLQVYNRESMLTNVSEPIECLEHSLAWKPSGRVVASTEKLDHKQDVVFFERNGLLLHRFTLGADIEKVHGLQWNSDSTIISVLSSKNVGGQSQLCIDLWTDKNYHWYLKQELRSSVFGQQEQRCIIWDQEQPLVAYIASESSITRLHFHTDSCVSSYLSQNSNGTANVIDNTYILSTPFKLANVPPPMSQFQLQALMPTRQVTLAGFGDGNDFVSLASDGKTLTLWASTHSKTIAQAKAPEVVGELNIQKGPTDNPLLEQTHLRQVAWTSENSIVGLGSLSMGPGLSVDVIVSVTISQKPGGNGYEIDEINILDSLAESGCADPVARLVHCPNAKAIIAEDTLGGLYLIENQDSSLSMTKMQDSLIDFCPSFDAVKIPSLDGGDDQEYFDQIDGQSNIAVVGLSSRQQLCIFKNIVTTGCSSFFLRHDYLIFTTSRHTLRFIRVNDRFLEAKLPEQSASKFDESIRRVERGSSIVLALPTIDKVVLQMPRGNLETIRPRALTLSMVRQWVDQGDYHSAFLACRSNRIDMNILYDHNPEQFIEKVGDFIEQVKNVDYLNLFVSDLKDEDVTKTLYATDNVDYKDESNNNGEIKNASEETKSASGDGKTNHVCKAVREALDKRSDSFEYMPTILTSYVRQHPPDIASALQRMIPMSIDERESSLTYLLFLVDVDKVYNAAMGLYDLTLALWVAQKSQRDPREYLTYLSELKSIESEPYRRFRIDRDLERNELALKNLIECYKQAIKDKHEGYWQEIKDFVQKHELYTLALSEFKGQRSQYESMSCLFGQHMEGKKWYADAGTAYLLGQDIKAAVEAYKLAGMWTSALGLATKNRSLFGPQNVLDLAESMATILHDRRLFKDAADVLLGYTFDRERAIDYLIEGGYWLEALRVIYRYNREDIIETAFVPGLNKAYDDMLATIEETKEKLVERQNRIKELRSKPVLASVMDRFSNTDENLDNVDVRSDTTSMASAYTTFTGTVTHTNMTGTSRRTARTTKNSKREKRKKARGKKGTIYEEAHLVEAVARTIKNTISMEKDVKEITQVLADFQLIPEAVQIQNAFGELVELIEKNANWIFDEARVIPMVNVIGDDVDPNNPNPTGKIEKPQLPGKTWRWVALV
ncbi:putative elongator complex protein 1 [Mycoemilia scoparia]|uniref:Elongator complex protein 1 n=1 Tax=Mycoemilia scoparia TaxID=417184 RepID=A0A9W8DX45_9FUNG|nr:putative elongator complex protein 1 [Mycoemilia scoparia]